MGFPTTPTWASSKHYLWHSNPESRPLCRTYFDKCITRPKVNLAWKIIKGEVSGDKDLAFRTVNLYDNDNAKMMAGRTAQTLAEEVLLGEGDIEDVISRGSTAFSDYKPRSWDNGKDERQLEICRNEYGEVLRAVVEGVRDAAAQMGVNRLEGEHEMFANIPGLALPYNGRPDFSKQIELKTKWSNFDQRAKSGKRTASLPTQPTWGHLCQVAGYAHGTGRPQCIVYANSNGYRVFTGENCDLLTPEGMANVLNHVAAKCRIRERQLQAASNVEELIGLVEPDFGHMWGWDVHPDVLSEAKRLWGFKK